MLCCIIKKKLPKWMLVLIILFLIVGTFCLTVYNFNDNYVGHMVNDHRKNNNGHFSVLMYNEHYYARLRPEEGFYVWDTVNVDNVGEIRPNMRSLYEQSYIFNYKSDCNSLFVAISPDKTYDLNSITKQYYREDIVFPNITYENIKSVELISKGKKLFNFDYTMNKCESDFSIIDKCTIDSILTDLEEGKQIYIAKENFKYDLVCGKSYYVIALLNSDISNLCYYVGNITLENDNVCVLYETIPFDNGAVLS